MAVLTDRANMLVHQNKIFFPQPQAPLHTQDKIPENQPMSRTKHWSKDIVKLIPKANKMIKIRPLFVSKIGILRDLKLISL